MLMCVFIFELQVLRHKKLTESFICCNTFSVSLTHVIGLCFAYNGSVNNMIINTIFIVSTQINSLYVYKHIKIYIRTVT